MLVPQYNFLEAQANITFDFLKHILASNDAVVFSPYSSTLSLAICYMGASGTTETELKKLLSPYTRKQEYYKVLKNSIDNIFNFSSEWGNLYIANGIFISRGCDIKKLFKDNIQYYLRAKFEKENVNYRFKVAKMIINHTSEDNHPKSEDLVELDSFPIETRIILTNTLHYDNQWEIMFNPSFTIDDEFYITNNKKKIVGMMRKVELLAYECDNDFHIVKIPYRGCDCEFILILPKERNNLHSLLNKMDGKILLHFILPTYSYKKVDLIMPKFRVESTHSMKSILTKMGLKTPFNGNADFTEMSSVKEFWIEDIVQKLSIKVNETGAESEEGNAKLLYDFFPNQLGEGEIVVKADHPFLYIILNNEKILFSGIYQ